ncbi:MAG: hypothetical protein KDH09_05805 [Chrysiogenetes bacterium]|nr:hypothetical protein [Chrysiogenetes bacterium]
MPAHHKQDPTWLERLLRFLERTETDRFFVFTVIHGWAMLFALFGALAAAFLSGTDYELLREPLLLGSGATIGVLILDWAAYPAINWWIRKGARHQLTPWFIISWLVLTQVHGGVFAHLMGSTNTPSLFALFGGAIITTIALGPRWGLINLIIAAITAVAVIWLESSGAIGFAPLQPSADADFYLSTWPVATTLISLVVAGVIGWGATSLYWMLMEEKQRELRQTRERLIRAESLASLAALVDGAAHEINNPLGIANSLLRTLTQEVKELEGADEYQRDDIIEGLIVIRNSVERISVITDRLLTLSGMRAQEFRPVSLIDAIDGAVRRLEQGPHPLHERLSVELKPPLAPLMAQRQLLELGIYHLLANAEQATRENGGAVRMEAEQVGDTIVLTIEDEGVGIDESIRATLFHPFVSTRDWDGVGLGLYVVSECARAFGGEVYLESPANPTRICVEWRLGIPE